MENKAISDEILNIYTKSNKRYGSPKIHNKLLSKGYLVGLKRVQRLMRVLGIRSIITKKYRPSSSRIKIDERENLLKRDFSTTSINQKWVTDITYINTIKDGWCYLASVMDLHSRKIIVYSLSKKIDTELALSAVKNAICLQNPQNGLILHSDLGVQYTSIKFREYIDQNKLISHSFSGKGCPYDNASIESFHATLKKEEANNVKYYNFKSLRLSIFEYIESWYNRIRIHSGINYLTPQKVEDLCRIVS